MEIISWRFFIFYLPLFAESRNIYGTRVLESDDAECAKIFNLYGMQVHLGLNQEFDGNLPLYNFIPVTIELRERCVLIMIDALGEISLTYQSVYGGEQCWFMPIKYARCESCLGKVPEDFGSENVTCAILYDAPLCSTFLGPSLPVFEGEAVATVNDQLYQSISSLVVRDGCALEIYDKVGFEGNGALATGTIHLLDPIWEDKIASYKCRCDSLGTSTTATSLVTELSSSTSIGGWTLVSTTASSSTTSTRTSITSSSPLTQTSTPTTIVTSISSTSTTTPTREPTTTANTSPDTTLSTTTEDETIVY